MGIGEVRIGVLGFAHGHVNGYCEEWRRQAHGVAVTAGWDHDAARASRAAETHGIALCADARELLRRGDVDAVVIAAETSLHAELVELAAEAGKAIALQKPMALTLAEADRIVEAVERHRVPFTVAWQMRVDPQNAKMKELLDGGTLGKVFSVRRRHGLSVGLQPSFFDSWHVNPQHNRDIWADDASHPIDFLHWLLGVPETVVAEIGTLHDARMPMDNGVAVFRYGGGPIAEVNCSFTCAAAENTTEIVCERGTIVQNYGDAISCNAPRPADAPGLKWYSTEDNRWIDSGIATPASHFDRIRALAGPLAAFFRGERPPIATAEEGRASLRMTLATYVAAREGRRVRIDEDAVAGV
ncbi:Gfo/Idh/MocA family oxidoreductase [Paenibacillus sp.]|uniref:Gfo/Idh/MocA family protein n=1 Tax=Paenibacillus sp. TaxID=58172 RepID=UPI002D2EF655|nr:Gfo/Idh/MocA family oxidoreductase [Paenibacillus sp.]HZG88191.1 Gfo/Idh/MocA family oxidoreductase [Paenibacillus sp.]